jgi:hypothetical protein
VAPRAGGEAERWGGDDHGLNMRFGGPDTSGNIRAEVRNDSGMCRGLAPVMIRVRQAIGADFRKVWDPARGHASTSTVKPPLEKTNAPTRVASSPRDSARATGVRVPTPVLAEVMSALASKLVTQSHRRLIFWAIANRAA